MNLADFDWTFIALALFCLIASFDALYYHHYKYKLHLYEETKFEHHIHGIRGIIFAPIAILFFVFDATGLFLLLGITFIALDIILEIVDIVIEDEARKNLGGTSRGEMLCHIFATLFRVIALALIFKEKGWADYSLANSDVTLIDNTPLMILGLLFCVSSFVGGLLHFQGKNDQKIKGKALVHNATF